VTGLEIEREMTLSGAVNFALFEAGQGVTVIYNPGKPRRAVVYEFCGYVAAGEEPG
jgi:hypothetical protein